MTGNDNRVKDENVFDYRVTKDQKVFLFWQGRQVMIVKDKEAGQFLKRMAAADEEEQQMIMAKITGNFKRGNEKNSLARP